MATRPVTDAERGRAAAVLGDARALASPRSHAHVAEEGPGRGVALWLEPPPGGEEGCLGTVLVPPGPSPRLFYDLALACARDALSRGVRRGYFTLKDAALLARIQRDFEVEPQAAGWEPVTGRPVAWEIHVDVEDAVRQLERALARLTG